MKKTKKILFSDFISTNVNSALFVYNIYYFKLAKIFVLRQFKMATNQTKCSWFESMTSIHVNFTEECGICTKKKILIKEILTKAIKIGSLLQA